MTIHIERQAIKYRDYNIMTYSTGCENKETLLILHGGPGVPCDYMRNNLVNAELVVLRDCSHDPFFEKPEFYHQSVWKFLEKQRVNNKGDF
ncbi:alpha/beta fold hydrolase [Piscirickettsia litoralis]|uniref:Prolyl aminopeptidase n=1 Tax=Piscirickettsia litoralis TaxID=1891921 RepID=A0ABX3A2F3_9GAMM|nr:hypothetical protein [Piscirickettsia litoralis]ODN43018.1 hypothetical protein BGC07_08945 [Piscirickettsia litoralis]